MIKEILITRIKRTNQEIIKKINPKDPEVLLDYHTQASEHFGNASKNHQEAAKQYDAGNFEKAAHHAHTAQGHRKNEEKQARNASKLHTKEYGNK